MLFYAVRDEIHRIEKKTATLKAILSMKDGGDSVSFFHKNNQPTITASPMQALVKSIKTAQFTQYRINEFLDKNEKKSLITVVNVSLVGDYMQIVYWITHLVPNYCRIKKLIIKKKQDHTINLMATMEIYEE
jgi:hypothetical protein